MRFRNGLVLCLLLTSLIGVGCRKALAPNADRNQPPETWITAAPQDTITIKNAGGAPLPGGGPTPTTIPFKFHLYWAGSDPDGDIAGFYYAVVETLPYNPLGSGPLPSLPGPKPSDYRFTSRTDSTFIFSASEIRPDRQHAFFIYAVDNNGKPDATPARVIFNAIDKYPPLVYFEQSRGTGVVWERAFGGGLMQVTHTYDITDSLIDSSIPQDSVPATARLDFGWRSEPVVVGNPAVSFRYKLDETDFVDVDSSTDVVTYNTGATDAVGPGRKSFTLRAIDQAGWKGEARRRFQFNLKPDTWFAGPDPNSPQFNQVEAGSGYRYYDICTPGGLPGGGFTGTQLSRDSVYVYPALRPERKTFFEIYKCRIYVHSEYDTVNMNSWVICHNGGLDPDSPYLVKVSAFDPELIDLIATYGETPPVLQRGPSNGSPIGFRANLSVTKVPSGSLSQNPQSGFYPIFDPTNVQRPENVTMAKYWTCNVAGQAYMFARAEDGHGRTVGGLDEEVPDLNVPEIVQIVGRNLTGGNDSLRALRRKILTFYVDHSPELVLTDGGFKPRPGTQYFSRSLDVNLVSTDLDPYDVSSISPPTGGPTQAAPRYRVIVHGVGPTGSDTTFTDYAIQPYHTTPSFSIVLPTWLVGTSVTLEVEVCDCLNCEFQSGSGRCRTYNIPVIVPPPPPAPSGSTSIAVPLDEPGPGSMQDGRSAGE